MSKIVVVHSLSESKLRKAIELGGMPLPSIAAMKIDNEFTRFGNITFILKPESVDPKDKKNLFFDRDIFSQRIPELYYDIDKKAFDKIYKQLDKMVDDNREYEPLFTLYDFDSLRRKPSEYIEERLKNSPLIKLMFMQSHNPEYQIPYKVDKFKSDLSNESILQEYMKKNISKLQYHDEELKSALNGALESRFDFYKENIGHTIAEDVINHLRKQLFGSTGDVNTHSSAFKDILSDVRLYTGVAHVINIDQLKDDLKNITEKNELDYHEFFSKYIDGVFVKPHLKNGTRKVEYNLDNISKFMLKQDITGAEDVSDTSVGKISSSYSTQFTSYDEMIDYVDRLDTMEDRHNQTDVINRRIFDLAEKLQPHSPYSRFFDVQECLSLALTRVHSIDQFTTKLQKQGFNTADIPADIINEGFDICQSIKNLSSHYFEGKPQKVIHFDDFSAVLLPKNTSIDIIESLKDKVTIHFYDKPEDKKEIFAQYSFDSAPKRVKKLKNF